MIFPQKCLKFSRLWFMGILGLCRSGFLKLYSLNPLNMKIATINTNGLDSRKNTLIQYMNQTNFDIYCLQEAHTISSQKFNLIEKKTLILYAFYHRLQK